MHRVGLGSRRAYDCSKFCPFLFSSPLTPTNPCAIFASRWHPPYLPSQSSLHTPSGYDDFPTVLHVLKRRLERLLAQRPLSLHELWVMSDCSHIELIFS